MEYIEKTLYIPKNEFNFLEIINQETEYFKENYPDYRLNSLGVYETEYDVDTYEVLVRFEYEA